VCGFCVFVCVYVGVCVCLCVCVCVIERDPVLHISYRGVLDRK